MNRIPIIPIIAIIMAFTITCSVICDDKIRNGDETCIIKQMYDVCDFVMNSEDKTGNSVNIMDAFYIIWGMSITIVLFLLESSNVYWHGVTLRRIINMSLGKFELLIGALAYFLLCPTAYSVIAYEKYLAGMLCVIYTYLIFCAIPLYVIYKSSRKQIEKLLLKATIKGLKKRVNCKIGAIQVQLEKLPVTDMIKHLDYNNTADVIRLADLINGVFCEKTGRKKNVNLCWDKDILGHMQHKPIEHIVVMVWVKKVIEYSGMATNIQRERTIYILRKLWEKISTCISNMESGYEEKERLIIGYSVEIILPLLKDGSKEASEVFHILWLAMRKENIRIKMTIYLLLYLEYLNYADMRCENVTVYLDSLLTVDLRQSKIYWDKDMAKDFWIGWIFLMNSGDNLALSFFHDFCDDIKRLYEEKYIAKTNIMRQVYLRRRKHEVY